jgi:hypothetical protein
VSLQSICIPELEDGLDRPKYLLPSDLHFVLHARLQSSGICCLLDRCSHLIEHVEHVGEGLTLASANTVGWM